jgi:hypothetical protein
LQDTHRESWHRERSSQPASCPEGEEGQLKFPCCLEGEAETHSSPPTRVEGPENQISLLEGPPLYLQEVFAALAPEQEPTLRAEEE